MYLKVTQRSRVQQLTLYSRGGADVPWSDRSYISRKRIQSDNRASLSMTTRSLRSLKVLGFVNTTTFAEIHESLVKPFS